MIDHLIVWLFAMYLCLCIPNVAHAAEVKKGDTMTDGTFNYIVLKAAKKKKDGTVAVYGLNKKVYNDSDKKTDNDSPAKLEIPGRLKYQGGYYDVTAAGSSGKATLSGKSSNYQYYWGNVKKIILPDSITVIADHAFADAEKLKTITIPSGVTAIGGEAFSGTSIKKITIPSSVSYIGKGAFLKCKELTKVTFNEGLEIIGKWAFQESGVKQISLPDGCTEIKQAAFSGCQSLKKFVIPASVEEIGPGMCSGCKKLEILKVDKGNSTYQSVRNLLYAEDGTILIDGAAASEECSVADGTLQIAKCAFEGNKKITSIVLPDSVETIGEGAFLSCTKLETILFGSGLKTMKDSAFAKCKRLTQVFLPKKIKKIQNNSFYGCKKLSLVTMGNKVTTVGDYAFSGCTTLKNVTLSAIITKIGAGAFHNNESLTSIVLPASLSAISGSAFVGCGDLDNISIDDNNNYYMAKDGVLYNKKGTEIISYPSAHDDIRIADTVTTIGAQAFQGSEVNTVTIPDTVMRIGEGAFMNCRELLWVNFGSCDVSLPAKVKDSDGSSTAVFYGCHSLQTVSAPQADQDDILQAAFAKRLKKHMNGNGVIAWQVQE